MKLANRITKIPNCRKRGLFCGEWLTIKVVICLRKAAGKTILNWQRLQRAAHVVIHFSVSVFSGNLHNLGVMGERTQMGKQASEKCSPMYSIF